MSAQLTLDALLDRPRLSSMHTAIIALDWRVWRSLGEIRADIGRGSEAGISARLREIRAAGYTVDKRRRGEPERGLWEYRIV